MSDTCGCCGDRVGALEDTKHLSKEHLENSNRKMEKKTKDGRRGRERGKKELCRACFIWPL
jgi:hypothetical protein